MDPARKLKIETEAAKALLLNLENVLGGEAALEDPAMLADTIEGETDLFEALEKAVKMIQDTAGLVVGVKKQQEDLAARKKRYETRIKSMKTAIGVAMEMAELRRREFPAATVYLSDKARGLIVTDESQIPPKYFDDGDPKLSRSRLIEALKVTTTETELVDGHEIEIEKGVTIPGAELDNGGLTVNIRNK